MSTNINRIDETFQNLKAAGRTALIPFVTTGDPDLAATLDILDVLAEAGADMVELGVPYSDPLADGPVIQRASERALARQLVSVDTVLETAKQSRERGNTLPFIFFSYYNPIFQYGVEKFFAEAEAHGISGAIIPDLPLEEDGEVRKLAERANVHLIPLVAPTSNDRVARIAAGARGFVYCVSSLGVTGVRSDFHTSIDEFLATVRAATSTPICVGFGISSREQVDRFTGLADGVIVGSAIVRRIEEVGPLLSDAATKAQALEAIRAFVAALRN